MIRRILIVFAILAVLAAGLGYLKYRQIQEGMAQFSQPPPPATVSATEVARATWTPRLRAVGSLRAVQGVMVNNEVPGQVSEILFESGALVERGDLLIQLDDNVDQADLAGLLADQALAEIRLERNARLLKSRAVSQEEFDEIAATLEKAEALVTAKRASIAKKAIRAPFAGQLGIRLVDIGEYLPAGSEIVPLEALDPVYVDFSLPERRIGDVRAGQSVEVRVAAYGQRTFSGTVQAINPSVDTDSRNVQVRAELANPELLLRPGMFAEVAILLATKDDVLTLPRQAIAFNTYGDSVLVIQEEEGASVVQRRQIRTGDVRGEEVEVLAGLEAGDRVVLAGHVKLRNGQAVEIVPDAQDAAAPAASDAP